MARTGGGMGRWVLAGILSTLAHGLLILAVVVVWSVFSLPTTVPGGRVTNDRGRNASVFWDQPAASVQPKSSSANESKPLDVVPFTAQLSPLAMVSVETKHVEPVRKMLRNLRGTNNAGLGQNEVNKPTVDAAGGRSAGWFATEAPAEHLAVVIDRSLSMGLGGGWNAARREANLVFANVPHDCLMRVWLFDKTVDEIASEGDWKSWSRTRCQRALERLEDTRPGGSTDLGNALRTTALRGATRIVVISDDADLNSGDWGAIATTLRRIGRPLPKLCAIRLGQQMREDNLGDLCRQSGGWCRFESVR